MQFGDLIATSRAISTTAERLYRQSSIGPLDGLIATLVAELLPRLAATESVIFPQLPTELSDALRPDHRAIRQLVERMTTVSEAMSRSRRARSETRTAGVALRDLTGALRQLVLDQEAALSHLEANLSAEGLEDAAGLFAEAAKRARAQIVLVGQQEIPPTEAHVMRRRPDLEKAFATNLADLESGARKS